MRINGSTGMNYTEATDYLLRSLMDDYQISRRDARKLLAETLVRTCVIEEIKATADMLIIKTEKR